MRKTERAEDGLLKVGGLIMTLITRLLARYFGSSRPDRYRWLHLGYPRWPTVTQDEQRQAEAIARRLYV